MLPDSPVMDHLRRGGPYIAFPGKGKAGTFIFCMSAENPGKLSPLFVDSFTGLSTLYQSALDQAARRYPMTDPYASLPAVVDLPRRHGILNVAWGGFLAVLSALVGWLIWLAHEGVDQARTSTDLYARNHIDTEITELRRGQERLIRDYSLWSDAWEKLFLLPDQEWIRDNFGQELNSTWGVSRVFIVYGSGPISEIKQGIPELMFTEDDPLLHSVWETASAVREASALSGTHRQASQFFSSTGTAWILAAGILSNPEPLPRDARLEAMPVLVMARALDSRWIDGIVRKIGLSSLSIIPASLAHETLNDKDTSMVPLQGTPGQSVAWLRFTTNQSPLFYLARRISLISFGLLLAIALGLILHLRTTVLARSALRLNTRLMEELESRQHQEHTPLDEEEADEEENTLAEGSGDDHTTTPDVPESSHGIPNGYVLIGYSGNIRGADSGACSLFGYKSGELDGVPVSTLLLTDSGTFSVSMESGATEQGPRTRRAKALHKSGTVLPVDLTISHPDDDHDSLRILISPRSADKDLAEKFLFMINLLPAGILVHRNLKPLFANQAFMDMVGLDSMEDLPLPGGQADTLMPMGQNHQDDNDGKTLTTSFETLYRQNDGSTLRVRTTSFPVLWDGDTAICTLMIDITGEHALRSLQEKTLFRLQQIIDTTEEGYIRLDADDLIVETNNKTRSILGYEPDDMQGRPITLFMTQESRDSLKGDALLEKTEIHRRYTLEFVSHDGDVIPLDVSASILTENDGTRSGSFVFFRDIRQTLAYEQALIDARETADRANRAKSDFLSRMSHELRTPLNAIIGFSQLMESSKSETLSDRQRSWLSHIHQSGKLLLTLIDEILDLARIESGQLTLDIGRVEPSKIIKECMGLTDTMAREFGVQVIAAPETEKAPVVLADALRMRQILLNLVSNAIKYNKAGGSVTIDYSRDAPDGYVRITVTDTGAGLPEERRADLFQPFNRLGQESGPIQGTGIGLSITGLLVKKMGGTIDFTSTVGTGSTFWFDLPAAEATKKETTKEG